MAVTQTYVQYDVTLPNRGLLISAIVAGWLVIASGLATLTWVFLVFASGSTRAFGVYQPSPFSFCDGYRIETGGYPECEVLPPTDVFSLTWLYEHWYLGFIPLVVGIVFVCVVQSRYNRFYRNVRQGKILERDTNGGGNVSLDYVIRVEGYTYANKLTTQWLSVNAGYWHEVRPGDWFDFRN
jgi:hypothetical protein